VTVVVLPGDGIGPEVIREARRALEALAPDVELEERSFGAQAIREVGNPLPEETLAACRAAEAVLKAPIGDPEFDAADVRPEQGMLRL
jgi:3-isopropylmalate dehydrogenase